MPSMPQATSTDPPATPPVPPAAPPTSEDFITIFGTEFRAMIDIIGPSEPIAPAKETTPAQETHRAMSRPRPLMR
ncbi:hypothetical protein CK203_110301 [Vitis vinifera]|uniref:Uncharacterized protein n=1 Tax=Vitis vinifera TaxID=29760 RepID=A0A438DGD5_VITVI|nr:hypothetical protein CK203_110301 [Vitis vinifera]